MKEFVIIASILLCLSCTKQRPELEVHRIMSEQMITLATAESCTGGTLSVRFSAIPGASAYFTGGIVAHTNKMKRNLLNVDCATIGRYGIVSEEVAREMAEGARNVTGADYAIATTGIADPLGGTPEIPAGTIWIAVATPTRTISSRFFGKGSQADVVSQASSTAINLLLNELNHI